jgi:hypothetical protein
LAQFILEFYFIDLVLHDYEISPGLIAVYLSAHGAVTMPAFRLANLKYAQKQLGALCMADSPSLKPFSVRYNLGGHAPACTVSSAIHLEFIACNHPNKFVRFYAAIFLIMILTSLRWIDAFRSPLPVRPDGPGGLALDGKAHTSKSSMLPMLWYCGVYSFLGSDKWIGAIESERSDVESSKSLFPNFDSTHIHEATQWLPGTASKPMCIDAYVYICMLPPLSLSRKDAIAASRLHGFRRLVPILARLCSSTLKLTIEDRNELGRWASTLDGLNVMARACTNLYSDEAHRPRAIEVRERVLAHIRAWFRRHKCLKPEDALLSLPSSNDYMVFCCGEPAFAETEPALDEDEQD